MIDYQIGEEKDFDVVMKLLTEIGGDRSPDMPIKDFIVAKDGNKLVGCARIKKFPDGCLELASLAVDSDYRRMGIGKVLVAKILEREPSRPIYLMCSIEKEPFYELNGFEKIEAKDLSASLKEEYERVLTRVKIPADQILIMVKNS